MDCMGDAAGRSAGPVRLWRPRGRNRCTDVEGFTLWYVDGRSMGKVTMTPVHALEGAHWPRSGEVLGGMVTIDETWAKPWSH
jgi:hypothetical protein